MRTDDELNGLSDQPEILVSQNNDSNGEDLIINTTEEQLRKRAPYKRKPWVYRSEHERILSFWKRWAYGWMFIAITSWIVWIIAILTK